MSTFISDINAYKKGVKFLADNKVGFKFPNSSSTHAAVVLANMLRTCNDVSIFDTNLKGDIAYQDEMFTSELRAFLENENKRLKIVVRDSFDSEEKQKLFAFIKSHKRHNNVAIKIASSKFIDSVKSFSIANHKSDLNFAVGDQSSYRMEEILQDQRYKASCNFSDNVFAPSLSTIFSDNFASCANLALA